jgi:hypothetical protein
MDAALNVRLRELRARLVHSDALLSHVVNLTARSGLNVQLGLSLYVGGATIQGVPAKSSKSADVLDADVVHFYRTLAALAASAGNDTEDVWSDILAQLQETPFFASNVDKEMHERDDFFAQLEADDLTITDDLSELPEELWSVAVNVTAPPRAVTLENASIRHGAGKWEPIGTVRVTLHQVQAWWTFRLGVPPEAVDHMPTDEEADPR